MGTQPHPLYIVYDSFISAMVELYNCIKDPTILNAQNIDNMVLAGKFVTPGLHDFGRKPTVFIKPDLL